MYLLLIIGNYKNICKKIMIFFHGHIFDPSEYFATDSDHLIKCCEISHMNWLNYILRLI